MPSASRSDQSLGFCEHLAYLLVRLVNLPFINNSHLSSDIHHALSLHNGNLFRGGQLMQNKLISIFGTGVIIGFLMFLSMQLCAQSLPKNASLISSSIVSSGTTSSSAGSQAVPQTWDLPQALTVKDAGTRTYRFTITYNTTNMRGEMLRRQRFTADYTRGLPGNKVRWDNVTEEDADGATAPYGAPQKRDFMDGFTYVNNMPGTFNPDFFKGFPPTAVLERNLVWDTGMFETFAQNHLGQLKLNEPYSSGYEADMKLPGEGTFRNRQIILEYIGRSERDGQDCALISYEAFFNPLEMKNAGMEMKGRSDYWGLIWVSLATAQVEYATLNETVTAEMKLAGQDAIQNINVLRSGDFELINQKETDKQ